MEKNHSLIHFEFWNFSEKETPAKMMEQWSRLFPNLSFKSESVSDPATLTLNPLRQLPHVIVIDQRSQKSTVCDIAALHSLELDTHLVVFRIVKDIAPGAETLRTLKKGIQYFITTPFDLSGLKDSLIDITQTRFKNHVVRSLRIPATHKITLHIASIEQAIASETLNIGSGGLFVRGVIPHLAVGDSVDFELQVDSELSGSHQSNSSNPLDQLERKNQTLTSSMSQLNGSGKVAWIRQHSESPNAPQGVGIQFETLSPQIEKLISKYLFQSKKVIPES